MELRTHIDIHGKLLIPSQIRKQLKMRAGDAFVLRVVDNEIRIINLNQVLSEVHDLVSKYIPQGTSLVEELREMRNKEVEIENEEGKK
ncbi:hypothetical protein [Candidatus Jidaibacter acanthamoebae]|uniref:hypothetical protein n=1 Tax=Candidatus Jidaibacter acanthamoebae TaxID=86105 RepID=UPI00057F704D|nr:hypothetical protein [Candidatus Jidaibacter acanthamoeba]